MQSKVENSSIYEDRYVYSGGTDSCEEFIAEFSASAPMVYKSHLRMRPDMLYPTSAGRRSIKVFVAILPRVVMVHKIAFPNLSRKGFCRNPTGIFPNKVPGEFCGGFFGGFFRAFFLGKNRRNKTTPKIHGKIQIGIWEFRGQNPHCKDPALKI